MPDEVLVRFDLWNVWAVTLGNIVLFGAGAFFGAAALRLFTRERRGPRDF